MPAILTIRCDAVNDSHGYDDMSFWMVDAPGDLSLGEGSEFLIDNKGTLYEISKDSVRNPLVNFTGTVTIIGSNVDYRCIGAMQFADGKIEMLKLLPPVSTNDDGAWGIS